MQNQSYNGWTNRETWQINRWFEEFIHYLIKEDGVSDAETLEDIIVGYILPQEGVDIVAKRLGSISLNGYVKDVIWHSIYQVNWEEIFDHHENED